ncbi:hypothetical protein IHQ68_05440 [Chelatococcus sambhunathii]|uniref:Uncharacterized protein n=1 Tax=Chelatococcus sambhunathii TaxID=363953 RepID=A0ABU1DDF0_9HYPH|nr:hypothetical protein [Chelatococcus sambhunathii]MDR4306064.1 hypothetical protein [Chelatococcus sambhunathii]
MFANAGGDLWLLMTVAGVVVLGAVIAYSIVRSRRGMTAQKQRLADRGAEEVYAAEQRDPANR